MSIDWPVQSPAVRQVDGPIRVMLRLSPRLFAFALAAPAGALSASWLIVTLLGGDARINGPIGLTAYLCVSALIIGVGGSIWTRRLRDRQSRKWMLSAVNAAPEAVIVTDARGRVTTMNGRAESMTGWAASEAVGRPIGTVFRLVDARTHRPVVNPLISALYKQVVVGPSHDALLVGKDGMEWQVHEQAAPIFDRRGSVFAGALAFRSVLPFTEVR
jgi:PAS domain S-box-containing protein